MNNTTMAITQLATRALFYEVALYPKPGLVDPIDNGAHHDMDLSTFMDSATALMPALYEFSDAGLTYPLDAPLPGLFDEVRQIGLTAEVAMYAATNHINTHKGAIFSFALLCSAVGHVLATSQIELADWTKANTDAVFTTIAQMTQALDHDFDNLASKDKLSYGEKLYLDYGIKGVRGEAAAGYPALRDYGLPFLRRTQNTPRHVRLLDLFLELLANTTDSNVIHRSDMATLRRIQHQVQALLAQGGIAKLGVEPMVQLNKEFIALNISPGGTADLLAASVFLGFLEKLFWLSFWNYGILDLAATTGLYSVVPGHKWCLCF